MEQYMSEPYFKLLLISLSFYLGVWIFAFLGARLIKGGNPYKVITWCWFVPLLIHTVLILVFMGYTGREMSIDGMESIQIFLYNIGFLVLLFINTIILFNLWGNTKRITY